MSIHLSKEQLTALNEKHGWFEYGDAQSNVSMAFALDAIASYEHVRNAAPATLMALETLVEYCNRLDDFCDDPVAQKLLGLAELAIMNSTYKP